MAQSFRRVRRMAPSAFEVWGLRWQGGVRGLYRERRRRGRLHRSSRTKLPRRNWRLQKACGDRLTREAEGDALRHMSAECTAHAPTHPHATLCCAVLALSSYCTTAKPQLSAGRCLRLALQARLPRDSLRTSSHPPNEYSHYRPDGTDHSSACRRTRRSSGAGCSACSSGGTPAASSARRPSPRRWKWAPS